MTAKDRPPTIKDVARIAGVGLGTVSRYLNASGAISDQARTRVAEAIGVLGYKINRNAASLRGRESRIIGVQLPDLDNAAFAPIVKAIEAAARVDGFAVIVTACDRDFAVEAEVIATLIARQVSGLIMIPTTDNTHDLSAAIGATTMPIVLLDREMLMGRPNSARVYVRHDSGVRAATQHLVASGHRQLLLLHAGDNRAARSRQAGFQQALDGQTGTMIRCDRSAVSARQAVEQALAQPLPPDAIIVGHNRMLGGVLSVLSERGLTIGKDISVVTSDRTELAELYNPPIAWIDRNFQEIGTTAYRFFKDLQEKPDSECSAQIETKFYPTTSIGQR